MSSPIQPAKDKDRDTLSMYAPSRKRNKPPVVDPPIKQPPQGRVVHAGGSPFSGLADEDSRRRRSLTPKIVPEPNFLKGGPPALALIALRLSGATAIAALIALVGVSLPAVLQRSGNDNIPTARLPNPADVQQQQDQSPTTAEPPSLIERRTQGSEPPPYGGSVERQSGIATVGRCLAVT
jgi:hypothetical protein